MDKRKLHIVAVTGLVEKNGRFLVIKRGESEVAYPGMWTVPGGKVEAPDSCKTTLKREIEEETGIKIGDKIEFVREYEFTRPDGYHVIGLTFSCQYESGKVSLSKDFTDFSWISPRQAKKYQLIPGILEELRIVAQKKR